MSRPSARPRLRWRSHDFIIKLAARRSLLGWQAKSESRGARNGVRIGAHSRQLDLMAPRPIDHEPREPPAGARLIMSIALSRWARPVPTAPEGWRPHQDGGRGGATGVSRARPDRRRIMNFISKMADDKWAPPAWLTSAPAGAAPQVDCLYGAQLGRRGNNERRRPASRRAHPNVFNLNSFAPKAPDCLRARCKQVGHAAGGEGRDPLASPIDRGAGAE